MSRGVLDDHREFADVPDVGVACVHIVGGTGRQARLWQGEHDRTEGQEVKMLEFHNNPIGVFRAVRGYLYVRGGLQVR